MKTFTSLMLLWLAWLATPAFAAESTPPYVEINIQGIEEVAPPLNRLADAIEKLSDSDKLSAEDQEKIVAVIGELKTLSANLDTSINNAKQKVTQAQNEISASIQRMILLSFAGLALTIIVICAAILFLFRRQVAPLIDSGATTVDKMADAIDNLSATAGFIARQGDSGTRRFARKQKLR
jgi:predicted PurR-regulated permease PerM